jgi:pectinesterase
MVFVSTDASGRFAKLQAAVDAAPCSDDTPTILRVGAGEYREKVHITKSNLRIVGEAAKRTAVVFGDHAKQTYPDGREKGTFLSYTMIITGNDVEVSHLTIQNDAGPGTKAGQAIALYAAGDRLTFRSCRLIAHQDTLFCGPTIQKVADNALPYKLPVMQESAGDAIFSNNRIYFENCYIQGDVDFIFGPYRCWFEKCTLVCNDRGENINGYYTAANTPEDQPYGFVFRDCILTGDGCGESTVYLGRPWRAYSRTVFLNCRMDACVKPEGWQRWGDKPVTFRYAEHGTYGARNHTGTRHPSATVLTNEEAYTITPQTVLGGADGWNPFVKASAVAQLQDFHEVTE